MHPTWAGTFVLAAQVAMFPGINFVLLDSDCLPVTLFEVEDLWTEAFLARYPAHSESGIPKTHPLRAFERFRTDPRVVYTQHRVCSTRMGQGALVVTEPQAELNAGLIVIFDPLTDRSLTGMPGHSASGVPQVQLLILITHLAPGSTSGRIGPSSSSPPFRLALAWSPSSDSPMSCSCSRSPPFRSVRELRILIWHPPLYPYHNIDHHRCSGDRPTVGLILVQQPRGEDERKARCEDQQFEVLGIDVEVRGQPAGPHSRTKPRGQDEKGAMAGTSSEPSKTNHGEITLDLSAAGRSGGRVETRR